MREGGKVPYIHERGSHSTSHWAAGVVRCKQPSVLNLSTPLACLPTNKPLPVCICHLLGREVVLVTPAFSDAAFPTTVFRSTQACIGVREILMALVPLEDPSVRIQWSRVSIPHAERHENTATG